jgi:hypothetical protein
MAAENVASVSEAAKILISILPSLSVANAQGLEFVPAVAARAKHRNLEQIGARRSYCAGCIS